MGGEECCLGLAGEAQQSRATFFSQILRKKTRCHLHSRFLSPLPL